MRLFPDESIFQRGLLFYPPIADCVEIDFVRKYLKPGDTFLDAGSHEGYYALVAASIVGPEGKVLAVEADPECAANIAFSAQANDFSHVEVVARGLSDDDAELSFGVNETNRGSSRFDLPAQRTFKVKCITLKDLLDTHGIDRLTMAKFDVEGFEYRVLSKFFSDVSPERYPRYLIVEHNLNMSTGNTLELLEKLGYRRLGQRAENYMYELKG